MTADDATRTARWSRTRGIRLDLACNGAGSQRYECEHGIDHDPLLDALLAERDAFRLDQSHLRAPKPRRSVPRGRSSVRSRQNEEWAAKQGIEFEPHVLITGEHTGLANLTATPPRGENPEPGACAQRARDPVPGMRRIAPLLAGDLDSDTPTGARGDTVRHREAPWRYRAIRRRWHMTSRPSNNCLIGCEALATRATNPGHSSSRSRHDGSWARWSGMIRAHITFTRAISWRTERCTRITFEPRCASCWTPC